MRPGEIDKNKSFAQWENLVNLYLKLDINVQTINQESEVPDMVFTADQGVVNGKTVLLSRFRHKQRQVETKYYKRWFLDNNYEIIDLPSGMNFEGNGELFFWNDLIFLGTGYRSDRDVAGIISKFFGNKVVVLEIVDPAFYHLDVGFFPLNKATIFYYPKAYSLKSQKTLRNVVPNLIEFTKEEALGFCANSVITDHHVICQKGNNSFEKKLMKLGYKTYPVELSEFMKSGGGAHCLTNTLEESYES
ncbi:MAG: arginine deiminase-related protein [Candidatus Woykebacteria bacterium]